MLETSIEAGLTAIANPQAVTQIALNLLTNAIKFTPDNGHISLSAATQDDGSILISVTDTGPGIPEHEIAMAVDPFFRGADPHVSSEEGAGLGLSVSDSLAKQMGFELTITNLSGSGLRATLLIPWDSAGPQTNASNTG